MVTMYAQCTFFLQLVWFFFCFLVFAVPMLYLLCVAVELPTHCVNQVDRKRLLRRRQYLVD